MKSILAQSLKLAFFGEAFAIIGFKAPLFIEQALIGDRFFKMNIPETFWHHATIRFPTFSPQSDMHLLD